ncbi:MAG TPA: hypothetical protein VK878_19555 [Candidatus Deferrimicrobiaceae bacterium]|nr:hypothetical protein [Candidatus Deferrimicrobiaceae bacterium]
MTRVGARALIATLAGVLTVAPAAHPESAWTLWERPVNPATGQPQSEWQRRQRFEGERWCKAAMTRAINQTLAAGWKGGRWNPNAKVTEYQCLPESADPTNK